MKVLLYTGLGKVFEKSGVGQAIRHQIQALKDNQVTYTERLSEGDFDIAQFNTVMPDSPILARILRAKGKKVIYYAHSTMEDFQNSFRGSNLLAPFFRIWIKFCYNSGNIIITPTPYSQKLLEGYGLKSPIMNLSNGINLEYYHATPEAGEKFREKYGFSTEDKVVLSVGHYMKRKGILDFISMASFLPEYKFIWFGHTPQEMLSTEVKNVLDIRLPNLYFPGYVEKEELREAYSGSNLFFFPTYEETEGIVLLEALAMRIPVLVRDIPIYEDWLPENKAVYKGKNLVDFKQKIIGIIEGKLPSLAEGGYAVAKARDVGVIGKRLVETYTSLSEGKPLPVKPACSIKETPYSE